jgi:hypothetical protein
MADVPSLAQEIAGKLAEVRGVLAVALGGSSVRGAADAQSDIDLALYYDPHEPLDPDALTALAAAVDDSGNGDAVTSIGAWGPWINGGAWLTIQGQHVDWLYRDIRHVETHMRDCVAGKPTVHYQPGHPHGFHTHIYLAEAAVCHPLADDAGVIASLRRLAVPYPAALKTALVTFGLWEADFALQTSAKSARRGDIHHLAGSLFRSAACLIQALFAYNEMYFLNEKGSSKAVDGFSKRPPGFSLRIDTIMRMAEPTHSHQQMASLVEEVRAMCQTEAAYE